jgi:predicted secreted acid phosphatase
VHHHKKDPNKAILFDIDDTTLNTYSYEIYSNFVFNPTTNGYFVNAARPVSSGGPGMVGLERRRSPTATRCSS